MPRKKNSRIKKVQNDAPYTNPMSGIFDMGGQTGVAPASQPFEFANNASYNLISLQRVMLTYSYILFGPLRTLVDQPVYDAFRGGFKVKSDEISQEEIDLVEREIKKLKLERAVINALRWDRLYGGSGVIINTDSNFADEFDVSEINQESKLEFKVADRWELAWMGLPNDPKSTFTYYGHRLHPSRVARIVGEEAPSLAAQRLQGWGMSVIECVLREMNSYLKENNLIFELLDEAKIDVWKIKGYNTAILSQLGKGKTAERIRMANYMKSFLNAVTLDSEDDFVQKTQTFSGLSEIMEQIRIGIAAAVRMPMAKIFGLAAKGFASGEDDIENYNAIVENQRDRARDALEVLVPVVCQKVLGYVPDDLAYEFKPLRVLSAEAEQNVLTQKYTRLSGLYTAGMLTAQEYAKVLKDEGILVMETEVSKGLREPEPVNFGGFDQEGDTKQGSDDTAKAKKEAAPQEKESEG
jgi:uncharacterized protein